MAQRWITRRRRNNKNYQVNLLHAGCHQDLRQSGLVRGKQMQHHEEKFSEMEDMLRILELNQAEMTKCMEQLAQETQQFQTRLRDQMQRHIEVTRQSRQMLGRRWTKIVSNRIEVIAASRMSKNADIHLLIKMSEEEHKTSLDHVRLRAYHDEEEEEKDDSHHNIEQEVDKPLVRCKDEKGKFAVINMFKTLSLESHGDESKPSREKQTYFHTRTGVESPTGVASQVA